MRTRPEVLTRTLLALLTTLAFGAVVGGCNDQNDNDDEHASNDHSSGGEDDANEGSDSESDGGGELPDDDLENDQGPGPTTPGSPTGGDTPSEEESPWGRPEAESGRPLPPRRPMNASARSAYQRGLQAAGQGNNQAAQQAFTQALSSDANAYKAAYNLGVMADRAGQEGRAMEFYQRSLRIQADYERAIEGIARIHLRRGNAAEAVDFVRPLAERWTRNLHIQAIYGDVLVSANRPEEGIAAARQALRRDERFVPAMVVLVKANLRLGRNELAESILDQAIETDDANAELHYLRGRMHQEAGNLTPALASYRRAVELEPGYTEARMALGMQSLASGNYQEALSEFRAASALAPTLPSVRLALGDAYRATKQWQQAKQEFDRVTEMEPRNAEVHFNLGVMYREAGETFPGLSAIEAYQRAQSEFGRYRELMGPRLPRNDPSETYIEELGRLIQREEQRIERDRQRAEREAARAAREAGQAQEGGGGE